MSCRESTRVLSWLAVAAAIAGCACGGRLEIRIPPDGGPAPLPDGGWPDAGPVDMPGPPDPDRTTLEVTPGAFVVADGTSRAYLRVTVRDAAGRPLSGVNVAFSATGTSNLFLPGAARGTTGNDGSVTVALSSTLAEPKAVTAALAAFSLTTQVTFVPGPPALGNSDFQLGPASLVADGVQAASMLVTLRDRSGNLVHGHEVFFNATGTSNFFTPSPAIVRTDGGVAQASLASTRAEAKTAVATVSGAFVLTQPVTFVHGPASLSTSSIVASPTVLVADNMDTATIRVVVRDAQGNPLPGQVVVFSVSSGESTNPSSPTTSVDGEVITQLRSSLAGAKTITALAAGLTLRVTLSFGSGAPSTGPSTLTASPASLLADGTQSTLLTVTLKDDAGNPVPDAGVAFSATGSGNRFTPDPPSGRSDVSGVFTARLSSTVAETKTVLATTSAFTLGAPVTFTVGPPSQESSRFSAGPQQVLANGADATTMTVVVRDAQGNPVPGQAVTFSATGTANTLTPATATTSASGAASATLRSTRAELKTLTATFATLSLSTTVSFQPGPPSQARSTLVVAPTRFTTDDPGTTITVTIRDAFDNPLQGRTVDLAASGSNNQWSIFPPSGETDVNGTFSDFLTARSSGTQTISAMCEALSMSTTITVDPGVPALGSVTAQPSQLRADGVQSTLITFTVTDWSFNPIPGQSVTLASDGSGNTWLDPTQGTTNAQGQFSARLTSTVPEWKMVSGRADALIRTATVVFNP